MLARGALAALAIFALSAAPVRAQTLLDESYVTGSGFDDCSLIIQYENDETVRAKTAQWALGYMSGWLMFDIETAVPAMRGLDAGLRNITATGNVESELTDRILAGCRADPSQKVANVVINIALAIASENR